MYFQLSKARKLRTSEFFNPSYSNTIYLYRLQKNQSIMTQKVVIKVHMNDQKSRSKAMKIAVSVSGVQSAAIEGQDKNQIEVTGDGIDAAVLTTLLRKKVGHADLVSVSSEKKEENPGGPKEQTESKPVFSYSNAMPPRICEVIYPNQYPYWDPNYNFFNMW